MTRAILFDLDGTLVDSLEDIGDALNAVLAERGLPIHTMRAYRTLVGDGARALVSRALPEGARDQLEDVLEGYHARYRAALVVKSHPYPGILALLEALAARGVPLAVVTNKPHDAAREIVARLFPAGTFRVVLGQREGIPHKPDPAGPLEAARACGVRPEDALFVGDTDTDMKTARNAGMRAVGVAWGFRDRAELERHGASCVVSEPAEIAALLA